MMDSGIERDSIHYNLSEDEGYNCPIMAVISPREPGKTTSITLDRVYADFRKKGLPAVALVNQAVDCTEAFMQSFENTINEFRGYEIHTRYTKGGIKGGIAGTGNGAAKSLTSTGHRHGSTNITHHFDLSRRTLLTQSIQSVIHGGVALRKLQSGFRGVGQEIGLAHGSTDHGTTVTVQTNIHCGVTSQKLTAPFLKGFRHTRRGFEGSGGAVPLDNCVFHSISSLFPAVTQIDIGESGNRPINFGIKLGFHFG